MTRQIKQVYEPNLMIQIEDYVRDHPGLQRWEIAKGLGLDSARKISSQMGQLNIRDKIEQIGGVWYVC